MKKINVFGWCWLEKQVLGCVPLENDMSDDEVTGYGNQTGNHDRKASPIQRRKIDQNKWLTLFCPIFRVNLSKLAHFWFIIRLTWSNLKTKFCSRVARLYQHIICCLKHRIRFHCLPKMIQNIYSSIGLNEINEKSSLLLCVKN